MLFLEGCGEGARTTSEVVFSTSEVKIFISEVEKITSEFFSGAYDRQKRTPQGLPSIAGMRGGKVEESDKKKKRADT